MFVRWSAFSSSVRGATLRPTNVLLSTWLVYETMHENRVRRLVHAGFTPEQASTLSDLHTPNFM